MNREDFLHFIEDNDVKFIRLQFTDICGVMKNIAVNESNIENVLDGALFDGSSVEGFARVEESDMLLVPDIETVNMIPWRPQQGRVARLISDVCLPDGSQFEGDPRYILKRVLQSAADAGYSFNIGPELEFFLFHTDDEGLPTIKTHDTAGYFDLAPIDLGEDARREICLVLEDMGFLIDASHHEIAPGQHEIDFRFDEALLTADNIMTFKMVVKIIAQKHGLHATFMPKPLKDDAGSGMHINMWLYQDGRDAFKDDEDPLGLSKDAYYFIGGIFKHINGITALANPLVNSYKRMMPGNEAPSYASWARSIRSPLIRIPKIIKGDTQIELLSPDATCNPYLTLAALLAAGIQGIQQKISPPPEAVKDPVDMTVQERESAGIKRLPENLGQALDAFEADTFLRDTLGEHAFSRYLSVKRAEWEEYCSQVNDWEIKRYLSIF